LGPRGKSGNNDSGRLHNSSSKSVLLGNFSKKGELIFGVPFAAPNSLIAGESGSNCEKGISMLKKLKNIKGAALVEYGILVGLIAVLAISAVMRLGQEVEATFQAVSSSLASSMASAGI